MADNASNGRAADGAAVVGQATSAGRVRSHNEDSVLCEPGDAPAVARHGLLCAVADGMGGHAAGDVASRLAVQTTRDAYYASDAPTLEQALGDAIAAANQAVLEAGSRSNDRAQMGSTLTAVVVVGQRALVGHVGDSRGYLVEGGRIRQLTRDHSWVAEEVESGAMTPAEAKVHPRRNVITRALGLDPTVDVDLFGVEIGPGSTLVVCSDGLHGPVEDDEIRDHVERLPPDRAADELVALANERGGPDNISVVVIRAAGSADLAAATGPVAVGASSADTPTMQVPVQPTGAPPSGEQDPEWDERAAAVPGTAPRTVDRRREPMAVPTRTRRRPAVLAALMLVPLLLAAGVVIGWLLFRPASGPANVLPPPVAAPSPAPATTKPAAAPPAAPGGPAANANATVSAPTATAEAAGTASGVAAVPAPADPARPQLVVIDDNAAVRASPVIGAPIAARLPLGTRVASEAEVNGGPANGSSRWHLVTVTTESPPVRGFVHSSVVQVEGQDSGETGEAPAQ